MTKTILITGASSGIGKATAKLFQQRGWNVVATMRNPDREDELNKLDNILVTRLDVTDAASIRAAVAAGTERFGRIDALVNNAGYGVYGPLEATPIDTIRPSDTNVIGLLETTKALLPAFRANREGIIINISSVGGKMTFPLGTLYHGTKFAVEGLSEALSFEMAAIGVRVKIVEPGAIKTDFTTRSLDFSNNESLVEYQDIVRKLREGYAPIEERASEPVVVAEVIYRAATDDTDQLRYIAGEDAEALLAKRKADADATFFQDMRTQFAL
jgi:NAD(P)-dependent dehydrogenase (short-subunit alcohol dehydrogenase family)